MALFISLDNGFGNMKLYFKYEGVPYKRDYESRVRETSLKTDTVLNMNGTMYDFKDAKLVTELSHKTKDDPIHRTLRDKALYEVYKITGETEFDLITNCSLDSYKDDRGESVRLMHEEQKEVSIEDYYGNQVALKVNNVLCYAENLAGVITCNDISLRDDTVIGIDIGTKNFQLLKLEDGKLVKTYSSTLGMNQIYMDAYDLVKTVTNKVNSPQDVKTYLRRTHKGLSQPIPEIDDAIYKALETEIFPEIENMLNNLDSLFAKYVFLGGGSDYLQRFLDKKFKIENALEIYFTKDSYYANAIGMYARGEKLLGYKDGLKVSTTELKKKPVKNKKTTKASKER